MVGFGLGDPPGLDPAVGKSPNQVPADQPACQCNRFFRGEDFRFNDSAHSDSLSRLLERLAAARFEPWAAVNRGAIKPPLTAKSTVPVHSRRPACWTARPA